MNQLFTAERLPQKPYCSNDKTASNIRMLSAAFAYTHIQFNPPGLRYWLVFDLDFGGRGVSLDTARWYYEDVLAPPPNIIVINPKNGHAHYYYALMTPVVRGENARRRPQDFADAVYRGLGAMLDADPDYPGLPQLRIHHFSSSSSSSGASKPSNAARNSSDVAASSRLVLMLVLIEVSSRIRLRAMWRTSARLWATWPVRARA